MKVWQLRDYFLDNSPWINRTRTVDAVLYGEPEQDVGRVGVCWYPALQTIRHAAADGCELLVSHEPLYWTHRLEEERWKHSAAAAERNELLAKAGMSVLRAHDSWDQWPEIGIRDSWARFLGFERRVYVSTDQPRMFAIYQVAPVRLAELAQSVADRVARIGEDSIRVLGDPDRVVSHPSLGVGCATPDREMVENGSDVLIMCYDGSSYWSTRERLCEMGAAVISMEHGPTEMPGIENLATHLRERFPSLAVRYYADHPSPWTVMGAATRGPEPRDRLGSAPD